MIRKILLMSLLVAGTRLFAQQAADSLFSGSKPVETVSFSSDGKSLVFATNEGLIRVLNVADKKEVGQIAPATFSLVYSAVSPDGKTIATVGARYDGPPLRDGSNFVGIVQLWDSATLKEKGWIKQNGSGNSLAFSPDSKTLATTAGHNTQQLVLVDLESLKQRAKLTVGKSCLSAVAYSRCGKFLATGTYKGEVKIWDTQSNKELQSFDAHDGYRVSALAFSPDSKLLVSTPFESATHESLPGSVVRVWEVETEKKRHDIRQPRGSIFVSAVLFSGKESRFLVASGFTILIYDAQSGKRISELNGHTNRVTSLALSPDGKLLASGSIDRTVRIWKVE